MLSFPSSLRLRRDLGSKIRVVFEDKASKDFQIFIERQTNALTLLLVACNWFVLPSRPSEYY